MKFRLKPDWALLAVLALAAVLRFWALPFGLPNLTRPDEQNVSQFVLMQIMQSFFTGHPSLNPGFFYYPSFYLYIVSFFYTLYYLLGHVTGLFPNGTALVHQYLNDWSSFLLISRIITACFGVLGVWMIARFAESLLSSRTFGLVAAALLAVTFLHVRDSHFGVTDIPATTMATGCLWLAVLAYRNRCRKALWASAAMAGLAASMKYPLIVSLLAPLTAFYQWHRQAENARLSDFLSQTALVRDGLGVIGWCLLAFLITSPFVLLDWATFSVQLADQHDYFTHLYEGQHLGFGWTRHFTFSLWHGLGPTYLFAGLIGILLALRSRDRAHCGVLAFAVIYYLAIGASYSVYVRYILPLVPVFAVYAAYTLQWLWMFLSRRMTAPAASAVALALGLLIAGQSLLFSIRFDQLLATDDTRTQARNWLIGHLRTGDAVGIGKALSHVDLPRSYRKYFLSPENAPESAYGAPPKYRKLAKTMATDELNPRGEAHISTYTDVPALRQRGIRYVVVADGPLSIYQSPPEEVQALQHTPGLLKVAEFPNCTGHCPPESAYDKIDAFYVPYAQLNHMQRPGPNLIIYQVVPGP